MVPAKRITVFSTQFPFLRKDEGSYPHCAACVMPFHILKHIEGCLTVHVPHEIK